MSTSLTFALRRLARPAGLALGLALTAGSALAQADRSWISIGSAGAYTPAESSRVEFSGNWARMPAALSSGSVTLRYNITPVESLFPAGFGLQNHALGMRFLDNGGSGRVQMRLRSYAKSELSSAWTVTTHETLDSDLLAASSSARDHWRCIGHSFNFEDRAYYIEVTLSKTAAAGLAQVGAVWLKPTGCLVSP